MKRWVAVFLLVATGLVVVNDRLGRAIDRMFQP